MNFDLVYLNYQQGFVHALSTSLCFGNDYFENLLFRKSMPDSLLVGCDSSCLKMNSFVDYYYEIYCSNSRDTIDF